MRSSTCYRRGFNSAISRKKSFGRDRTGITIAADFESAVSYPVNPEEDLKGLRLMAGLCASCAYARRVESSRGSVFYLCERSAMDPRFTRYPRLPVLECSGYAKEHSP